MTASHSITIPTPTGAPVTQALVQPVADSSSTSVPNVPPPAYQPPIVATAAAPVLAEAPQMPNYGATSNGAEKEPLQRQKYSSSSGGMSMGSSGTDVCCWFGPAPIDGSCCDGLASCCNTCCTGLIHCIGQSAQVICKASLGAGECCCHCLSGCCQVLAGLGSI